MDLECWEDGAMYERMRKTRTLGMYNMDKDTRMSTNVICLQQ